MIKNFYAATWILLMSAAIVSLFSNNFNGATLVFYGLVALGLVYALALWTVIENGRDHKNELFTGK